MIADKLDNAFHAIVVIVFVVAAIGLVGGYLLFALVVTGKQVKVQDSAIDANRSIERNMDHVGRAAIEHGKAALVHAALAKDLSKAIEQYLSGRLSPSDQQGFEHFVDCVRNNPRAFQPDTVWTLHGRRSAIDAKRKEIGR